MLDRFLSTPEGMSRRHFMGHMATTAMALPAMQFVGALHANAEQVKKNHKSCILLWMGGGPSHMDTWDLKPDSEKNGGEFRPIQTSAPGVMISEHLPTVAKQFKHLNVLRSLDSKEGNHDRGSYMLHTGYQPNPTVVHPGFGSILSYENADKMKDFDLPHCVAINSAGHGAGFLGMAHAPFMIQNPMGEVTNLHPPAGVDEMRMARRVHMLELVEGNFTSQKRGLSASEHAKVYKKTLRLMNSQYTKSLSLKDVPEAEKERYGKNGFGAGCLMARRLVEQGVSFVEVSLGGWDNHANIFPTLSKNLLPQLDKGMGALVEDLAKTGMIENTMVVWMGDFGRTPRINQNAGRDHWPRSWSIVMGGAGMKGGHAIGATDKDGVDIVDRPLGVNDVVACMVKAMGIDVNTRYTTPNGRPFLLVPEGGKPIPELF